MIVRIDYLDIENAYQRAAWQKYVEAAAEATFFHQLNWMDAIQQTFGHRPHYLMAMNDDTVIGVFPLFEIRSFLVGTILVSVPYAVYGGAVADSQRAYEALLAECKSLAEGIQAKYVDIRSMHAQWSILPTIDRYATFTKEMPKTPEEVIASYPRKSRAEIRRARDRHQLSVKFDDRQLPIVWQLYSRSMRRLGSPNMPYRLFEALLQLTPERHHVSVIYEQDRPVAGLLSFSFRGTVLPYYSGCDEHRANHTGANNLLYSSLMEHAVSLGLRQFDFGRTRVDNQGAFAFKKNQGFEATSLGYQYYKPSNGIVPNLSPSNRKFQFAQRVWRRLPLPVTRVLGAWVSASIPG